MANPFTSGYLLIKNKWYYFTSLERLELFLDRADNGFDTGNDNGKPLFQILKHAPEYVVENQYGYILAHSYPWKHFLYVIKEHADFERALYSVNEKFRSQPPIYF